MAKSKKVSVICDVDTGIDDAVGIALALEANKIDLKLLTTTAGNTSVENVTLNSLTIMQWFGRDDIPVAQGASKPLKRRVQRLSGVHGGDTGMGSYPFPKTTLKKYELNAVDAMAKIIEKYDDITVICTAPPTNVAQFILKYPDLSCKIKQIVFQSGLLSDSTYPSFNVTSDPEATEIIINSGIDLLICPSDMGHVTCLNNEEVEIIRQTNVTGDMFATIFAFYRDRVCQDRVAMHDSCAVACVAEPSLFEIKPCECSIISGKGKGKKIFKLDFESKKPNCKCCTKIDIQGFKHYMFKNLKKCK